MGLSAEPQRESEINREVGRLSGATDALGKLINDLEIRLGVVMRQDDAKLEANAEETAFTGLGGEIARNRRLVLNAVEHISSILKRLEV